ATFAWITGAFTIYTFIAPVLTAATGWTGPAISGLLLAYGAAAVAGNALGGQAADRWGARRSIVIALSSLVVSLTAVAYAAQRGPAAGTPIAIIAVIAWAGAGWSLTPAQAHRLIALTPAAGPEVLSLNTSVVYLGIAAGAALGGTVLSHLGVPQLALAGAALQLLALVTVTGARARDHPAAGPALAGPWPPARQGTRSEPGRTAAPPGPRAARRPPAPDHSRRDRQR
ncbi:MAG: MFS transporter, partial [Streptosporangiaceae bacterium]